MVEIGAHHLGHRDMAVADRLGQRARAEAADVGGGGGDRSGGHAGGSRVGIRGRNDRIVAPPMPVRRCVATAGCRTGRSAARWPGRSRRRSASPQAPRHGRPQGRRAARRRPSATWAMATNRAAPLSNASGAARNIQLWILIGRAPNARPQRPTMIVAASWPAPQTGRARVVAAISPAARVTARPTWRLAIQAPAELPTKPAMP